MREQVADEKLTQDLAMFKEKLTSESMVIFLIINVACLPEIAVVDIRRRGAACSETAVSYYAGPLRQVIVAGSAQDTQPLLSAVQSVFCPDKASLPPSRNTLLYSVCCCLSSAIRLSEEFMQTLCNTKKFYLDNTVRLGHGYCKHFILILGLALNGGVTLQLNRAFDMRR